MPSPHSSESDAPTTADGRPCSDIQLSEVGWKIKLPCPTESKPFHHPTGVLSPLSLLTSTVPLPLFLHTLRAPLISSLLFWASYFHSLSTPSSLPPAGRAVTSQMPHCCSNSFGCLTLHNWSPKIQMHWKDKIKQKIKPIGQVTETDLLSDS